MSIRHARLGFVLFLLVGLRGGWAADDEAAVEAPLPLAEPTAAEEADRRLRQALARTISMDVADEPLSDVLRSLGTQLGINVIVAADLLAEEGIPPDEPVTLRVADVTAKSALSLLLGPLGLRAVRRHEVLYVTTITHANELFDTKVYDVADLVVVPDEFGEPTLDYRNLMMVLYDGTSGEWEIFDGFGGSVSPIIAPGIRVLVVRQTERVHEEIEEILRSVRRLRRDDLPPAKPAPPTPFPQGFSSAPARRMSLGSHGAEVQAVAQAANRFAVDLYRQLADGESNVVVSPHSVQNALAVARLGARGRTADELAAALHITDDAGAPAESEYNAALAQALRRDLLFEGNRAGNRLIVANRLWGQEGHSFLEPFLTAARDGYGADLAYIDFRRPTDAARTINDWAAQHTQRMIPQLVSPSDLSPSLRLVIANAVYFEGRWNTQFPVQSTAPAPFRRDGTSVEVPMMHLDDDPCRFGRFDGFRVLEKPYTGGSLSLVVLLPDDATTEAFEELERSLTEEALSEWLFQLTSEEVKVCLPRFRVESTFQLADTLRKLGIRQAFDPQAADFSGMDGRTDLFLGPILHGAVIEVDEAGSKAAAATLEGFFGGPLPVPEKPVFCADHPFVFLIRDHRTGTILFMGRYVNPPASPH